ncbi:MAG TPA: bifunctional 5,10-methylene-tetrahydrofolate dehydrogenase/5,10-methylene-tetrahydrofolate cyclohydrolase [Clostridiales bacterium]|nr:bifunctional 5,10-methylene-tetrahydrofolate dehydrogenase/5,10-methylene-tetrahydrofolate cyclohydrolase [Clostridiales bacterium]
MAQWLSGKQVAEALGTETAEGVSSLISRGILPCLAILRVGDDPGDQSYERGAVRRCESLGINVRLFHFPDTVAQEILDAAVEEINRDESIHSCLLLRPLPPYLDDEAIRSALAPEKDTDGITDGSLAGVFSGSGRGFAPCTAEACIKVLEHYKIGIEGKNVVVVGRSLVIGRPVAMLLLHRHATVTLCHTRTKNIAEICRQAEILVVAAGRQGVVDSSCFRPGQVVLDVGIHVGADGKITGDVDFSQAEPLVSAITPVPGGIGAVTTAVLAAHVVKAAEIAGAAGR